MSPEAALLLLMPLMELSSLFALATTGEVSMALALTCGVFAVLSYVWRRSQKIERRSNALVPEFFLGVLFVVFVAVAIFLVAKWRWHPVVAGAHVALLIQSLLWFARSSVKNFYLRLVMGFVNISMSASLSPELHTGFFIFAFFVIASVALFMAFLSTEAQSSRRLQNIRVSRRWMVAIFAISFVVFILSLAIFPLLPRPRAFAGGIEMGPWGNGGLREDVDLSGSLTPGRSDAGIEVRIFTDRPISYADRGKYFPGDLLRGRVLDLFDGTRWFSSLPIQTFVPLSSEAERWGKEHGVHLEILREPIQGGILPVPYQTVFVGGSPQINAHRGRSWTWEKSANRRIRYDVWVGKMESKRLDLDASEHKIDQALPENWMQSLPIQKLADQMTQKNLRATEKMAFLRHFFVGSGNFSVGESRDDPQLSAVNHVDTFLNSSHVGPNEIFAMSAAAVLRRSGTPTRLVTGYRLSEAPRGRLWVARKAHAHTWLEVWNEDRLWVPFDVTPFSKNPDSSSWTDLISDAEMWMSSYWYKYVLESDPWNGESVNSKMNQLAHEGSLLIQDAKNAKSDAGSANHLVEFLKKAGALMTSLVVGLLAFSFARRRFGRNTSGLDAKLELCRRRMLHLCTHSGVGTPEDLPPRIWSNADWQAWFGTYQSLRFGRKNDQSRADLDRLELSWEQHESHWRGLVGKRSLKERRSRAASQLSKV